MVSNGGGGSTGGVRGTGGGGGCSTGGVRGTPPEEGGGRGDGGGGGGERAGALGPQSVQSVPYAQALDSEPGPPSSQAPLLNLKPGLLS